MSDNPSILGDADPGWQVCSQVAPHLDALRFDPAWRTSTVVALASGIVQDESFDVMPILADALEDDGCDNTTLLEHCRRGRQHTKDCWALQLVMSPDPSAIVRPKQPPAQRPILVEAAQMVDDLGERNMWFLLPMLLWCGLVFIFSTTVRGFLDSPSGAQFTFAVIFIFGVALFMLYLCYCVKLVRDRRQRRTRR